MTSYEQSDRLKRIPPYLYVRLKPIFDEKRAMGWDMIDFGIGDPDLPAPDCIVEEIGRQVAVTANQKYSTSAGERDLRVAVAEWYGRRFGVDIDPDTQVCITIGSKEAVFHIAQAFVDRGETIIVPSPGYPVYSGASVAFNEADCVLVPLKAEDGWLLDLDEDSLKAVVRPSMPGLTTDDLVELVDKIYVHEGGKITIKFKFEDAYEQALEFINLNYEAILTA